jgi:hypothetical protein
MHTHATCGLKQRWHSRRGRGEVHGKLAGSIRWRGTRVWRLPARRCAPDRNQQPRRHLSRQRPGVLS